MRPPTTAPPRDPRSLVISLDRAFADNKVIYFPAIEAPSTVIKEVTRFTPKFVKNYCILLTSPELAA
jgi:hypothetical protein